MAASGENRITSVDLQSAAEARFISYALHVIT
jgi:hypothetical protein